MRVSIVIPAYNEERCIAETIEKATKQDYPNFEIIVVDNASTDKTAEIVSTYKVILVHEPRKGLLYARERGRIEAKGEIIANMDADCRPDIDWLSSGVRFFEDKNIVAVTGPYDYYDGSKFFRIFSLLSQKYAYSITNTILNSLHKGAVLIGGNNFIRAKTLEEIGGYNTSILFYGEDTDTARRVSTKGRVMFSRKLKMQTSARRFKSEGTVKIIYAYLYHFFKVIFSAKI